MRLQYNDAEAQLRRALRRFLDVLLREADSCQRHAWHTLLSVDHVRDELRMLILSFEDTLARA